MADQPSDQLESTNDAVSDSSDGIRGVWDRLIAEDETEVDVDLLSAYAEGRLSSGERERFRSQIAGSPRAIEMLDELCEHVVVSPAEHSSRPAPAAAVGPAPSQWQRALPTTVAAAMLLGVVGLGMWGARTTGELAQVRGQLVDVTAESEENAQEAEAARQELNERENAYQQRLSRVAVTAKDELVALAGDRRPFMTPSMSPQLVARVLEEDLTGRSVGDARSDPSLEEQIDAILSPVREMFAPLPSGEKRGDVLEWVDVLIAAGDWRQAQELMEESDFPETAESLNLQAGILIAEVDELTDQTGDEVEAQIRDRRERARELLREAVELDPEFDAAWFNLYQVQLALKEREAARSALDEYTRLTGRTVGEE